jgi:hypothetical protein
MLIADSSIEVTASALEQTHEEEANEKLQAAEITNNEGLSKSTNTRRRGRGHFRFTLEPGVDHPSDTNASGHNLSLLHGATFSNLVEEHTSHGSVVQQPGEDSSVHEMMTSKPTSSQQEASSATNNPGRTFKLKDYLILQKAKVNKNFHTFLDLDIPMNQGS